jgi:hypothetical protein
VLLSDQTTAEVLKNNVIPCWEMVREVPKVTIDFGDRKLERTLVGNTVMYLCSTEGTVVDFWPGVYLPEHFLPQLNAALGMLQATSGRPSIEQLQRWHSRAAAGASASRVDVSYGKMVVEAPILRAMDLKPDAAKLHVDAQEDAKVAEPLRTLGDDVNELSKIPADASAVRASYETKEERLSPEELGRRAVLRDSANNMKNLRPALHKLMAGWKTVQTPQNLMRPVFKYLLHVPIDDPYLGLADAKLRGTQTPEK